MGEENVPVLRSFIRDIHTVHGGSECAVSNPFVEHIIPHDAPVEL